MDYDPQPRQVPPFKAMSINGFLAASVICAAFSFISECALPICMIFVSLSIVFAILSKGKQLKMHIFASISVGISVFSLVLSFSVTAASVYRVLTDPVERENFNRIYEQMYGESFDDSLNEIKQLLQ